MDCLDALVYVADMKTHEVLFINKYGRNICGDVVGETCWKVLQADQSGPCSFCSNDKLVDDAGNPTGVCQWGFLNTLDQQWYECRDQAIPWGDGRLVRLEIATNITKRKESERALQVSEIRASALLAAIPDLVFRMDRQGVFLSYIVAKSDLYASHIDTLIGVKNRDIAPKEFADLIEEKIALTLDTGKMQTFEYQLVMTERGQVDYEARMVKSGENEITAIVRDVTKRKQAFEALKASEAQARALLEAIPDLVFRLDRQGVFLDYKAEKSDLYSPAEDTLIGKKNRDLVPPAFADLIDLKIEQTLNSGKMQTFEYQLPIPERGMVDYEARMVKSGSDEVTAIVRDVTDRKQIERKLMRQAITDPLTGIFNRRHFFGVAEKELKRAKRYHHSLSVVIFDIDHFKRVNDTYGHSVGDDALCKLTKESHLVLRETDIFARYGGEEFVILLPETGQEQAYLMAERIRRICAGTASLDVGDVTVSLTVSFGVASLGGEALSLDELILRADTALYASKKAGRNRVTVWRPGMGE